MSTWKNRIIETAEMKVSDLKANPKNWRKHPTAQQNALTGVLDTVGWVQQVIWNRQTGHLVDGHLRVELAAKRKEKTIPVNVVDLSPEEEAMILATFDPIAAMAEADRQMLQGLMESIETEDEQIQALLESIARDEKIDLGGEPAEAPEPQIDRAAELQEQWQTAPGQLWQCGDHRVLCGDSTNAEDVARLMCGEMAAISIADPPYNLGYEYADYDDSKDPAEYRQWCEEWLGVCRRLSGMQIVTPGNANARNYDYSDCCVWSKKFSQSVGRFAHAVVTEPILLFGEKPKGKKYATDLFEFMTDRIPGLREMHTCPKPIPLWCALIEPMTDPGDSVFDPFLGSGTTMIACEQLGRRCFGMEISPAYVAVILQRWHDMTGRDPVLLET